MEDNEPIAERKEFDKLVYELIDSISSNMLSERFDARGKLYGWHLEQVKVSQIEVLEGMQQVVEVPSEAYSIIQEMVTTLKNEQ